MNFKRNLAKACTLLFVFNCFAVAEEPVELDSQTVATEEITTAGNDDCLPGDTDQTDEPAEETVPETADDAPEDAAQADADPADVPEEESVPETAVDAPEDAAQADADPADVPEEETVPETAVDAPEDAAQVDADPADVPEEGTVPETAIDAPEDAAQADADTEQAIEDAAEKKDAIAAAIAMDPDEDSVAVYASAEPSSAVIIRIENGQAFSVFSIKNGWAEIGYKDLTGFVLVESIALYMNDSPVVQEIAAAENIRTIDFVSSHEGRSVAEGEVITLTALLTGFEDTTYTLQWQYSPDNGATILNAPGGNDLTYSFTASKENISYLWRLYVEFTTERPFENEAEEETDDGYTGKKQTEVAIETTAPAESGAPADPE